MKFTTEQKIRGAKRLLKLARHLRKGQLAHARFYFGTYNRVGISEEYAENWCGTEGCAFGENPAVWPKSWEWTVGGIRLIKAPAGKGGPLTAGQKWFSISMAQYERLFLPKYDSPHSDTHRATVLPPSASKEEVALGLEKFANARLKKLCKK